MSKVGKVPCRQCRLYTCPAQASEPYIRTRFENTMSIEVKNDTAWAWFIYRLEGLMI